MRHSGGVYFYVQFPEIGQNRGATRGDVEARQPCDHVVGFIEKRSDVEWLIWANERPSDYDGPHSIEPFTFCPRCGERLEER